MDKVGSYSYCIIFIFFFGNAIQAQNPELLFEEANRVYAQGDYENAVNLYQKIVERGIESGEVYFNLGNAYYKLNEIGLSILYYEKAKKFIEGDPALEQNLALVQLKIVDKIDAIPKLFIEEWWHELLHFTSMNTMLWTCLFLFTLTIILIIFQILNRRSVWSRLIWIVTTVFLIMVILTLSRIYEFETLEFGIILEEKVSVLGEPDINGTEVFILHEGTKVSINRMLDGWYEISIPDGKTGWLQSNILATI